MMEAVIFAVCSVILIVALLWLLLPRTVVQIPVADAEDRELGLYCRPESLWDITAEVNQLNFAKPIDHYQLDSVIRILAGRHHVIMAPCHEDIEQAASLLEGRMIP